MYMIINIRISLKLFVSSSFFLLDMFDMLTTNLKFDNPNLCEWL